jgi:hypothetical protein
MVRLSAIHTHCTLLPRNIIIIIIIIIIIPVGTLKMEAISTSETLGTLRTTLRYEP